MTEMSLRKASAFIHESWRAALKNEFEAEYFLELQQFVANQRKNQTVFPAPSLIFNALNVPVSAVKVVVIGQDPYHGPGQAHGLSFSVPNGIKFPPSLVNIFKELETDLNIKRPHHGNLSGWAEQGVLLLNATLTVNQGAAGSHQNQGWEKFTDAIINHLNQEQNRVVFLLWGRFAQQKAKQVDDQKHLVLKAAHPSPLSAYNGFWGCRHFSKANHYLTSMGKKPIDWSLL